MARFVSGDVVVVPFPFTDLTRGVRMRSAGAPTAARGGARASRTEFQFSDRLSGLGGEVGGYPRRRNGNGRCLVLRMGGRQTWGTEMKWEEWFFGTPSS